MADLPSAPTTRREQYLNAIATGDTSGLPDPVTREEVYLGYIAKNGGGGSEGVTPEQVRSIIALQTDDELSSTSENPVQNKVVNAALVNKVDAEAGKGLSSNDYTTIEKNKLADLQNYDDTEIKTDIADMKAEIGIGYDEGSVVGVQADFENKTFKRLASAVGLTAGTDFNSFNAFGGRRRCNVADNGTINSFYGESGYIEDGSNGQVMVYQPKFYYKMVPLKLEKQTGNGKGYHIRKANYYVSDTKVTGFKVHPAFVNAGGDEVDYILIGAYEGSLYDVSANEYIADDAQVMNVSEDKFCSIAGVKPASGLTQNLTRPNVEALCLNRGTEWHAENIQIASMTQLLMLVEYGQFDFQRVLGKGVVDITDSSSYNCSATTGSTAALGNSSGRAASTDVKIGDETTAYTADGQTSISYRGQENVYGNIWEFVMGINIYGDGNMNGGEPYICYDYNYAESKNTDNYFKVGFTLPNNNNYISAFGYGNADFDWLFIPSEATGASNALPVGDYEYITSDLTEFRTALLSGNWSDGWSAGVFYWLCDHRVGRFTRYIGGRLAFIPQTA